MIYQQDWLMRQIEAITSYYPTLLFLGDYSIIGYSASTSAFFRVRTNSVS